MKKIKKIMSAVLSAAILMSTYVPFAKAEDEIVYSYINDDGVTVSVTESDIAEGHWNIDYMSRMPIEQFEAFPLLMESDVSYNAELSLSMTYLKVLGENDSATLTIKEYNTDNVYFFENFDSGEIVLNYNNLTINKIYDIILSETIDGETTQYSKAIRTYYKEAIMPENVSLYANAEHDLLGITAGKLRLRDVTLANSGATETVTHILPTELPAFYSAIADDHLYSLQASTGEDIYKGFVSKNTDYACPYIFLPTYSVYDGDAPQPVDNISVLSGAITESEYENMIEISHYTDTYRRMEAGTRRLFKFRTMEDGAHYIRTYGSFPVYGYYCVIDSSLELPDGIEGLNNSELDWSVMGDSYDPSSINKNIETMEGCYVYFLLITEETHGYVTIDVGYAETNTGDTVPNSKYQASMGTATVYGTEISSELNYIGDTDIYKIANDVDGKYSFITSNMSSRTAMQQRIYYCEPEIDEYFFEYETDEQTIYSNGTLYVDVESIDGAIYYVELTCDSIYYTPAYTFRAMSPTTRDDYEIYGDNQFNGNKNVAYPLSEMTSPVTDLTLSKTDSDCFKFTMGTAGSVVISIDTALLCTELPYTLTLEDYEGNSVWTATESGTKYIINANLLAGETYYIIIEKPNSESYCPGHTYTLEWVITPAPVYSAEMTQNVEVSENVGEATLSGLMQTIASNTTFKLDNNVVPTATAINDLVIYYNNAELTETALSALTAGTYTLTAKYNGVDLTGGTITLTLVASQSSNEPIELTFTEEYAPVEEWDWVACAKIIANYRRVREESTPTNLDVLDGLVFLYTSKDSTLTEDDCYENFERVSLADVAKTARYFYTDGTSSSGISFFYNSVANIEQYINSMLTQDKLCVMYLQSSLDSGTDMTNGRYVVVCGEDTEEEQYKIYDPYTGYYSWVDYSDFTTGGVLGRTDLTYSGLVVDYR